MHHRGSESVKFFTVFPRSQEQLCFSRQILLEVEPWSRLSPQGLLLRERSTGQEKRPRVGVAERPPWSHHWYPRLRSHSATPREFASCHLGVNNYYSPEFILLITDTVPEDFPDKPELDHGLDGMKSLPGVGRMPFLIFMPNREEMCLKAKYAPDFRDKINAEPNLSKSFYGSKI